MKEYKIGDHVVIEESNIERTKKYAGATGVIKNIWHTPSGYDYMIKVDHAHDCIWCKVKCLVEPSGIKRVIFNDPATGIIWNDGTKTVAKCVKGDKYDPEKGFAIAYAKKFGGKTFREEMEKWCAPVIDEKAKNEPLTTEEIMEMDGKKVWLLSLDKNYGQYYDNRLGGWHTVNAKENKLLDEHSGFYYITENNTPLGYRAYLTPQTGKKG